jgi:hypothetical protein
MWSQPGPDGPEYEVAYFDEVGLAIRLCGAAGFEFLWEQLELAGDNRISGVLLGITWHRDPDFDPRDDERIGRLHERLIRFLDEDRRAAIPGALDGLSMLELDVPGSRLEACLAHEDDYIRCAALRYLTRTRGRDALPLLIDTLGDLSSTVRYWAIWLIDDLDALASEPVLADRIRSFLGDPDEDVRDLTVMVLEHAELDG